MHFILAAVIVNSTALAGYVEELNPAVSGRRARQLARTIDLAAREYGQDPVLLAAIVKKESNFTSGLLSCNVATWVRGGRVHHRPSCDFGLAQVNNTWIEKWDLDVERLQYDDRYNLRVAARILRVLKRYHAAQEPNWFSRYHSGTPQHRSAYEAGLWALLPAGPLALPPVPRPTTFADLTWGQP